MLTLMDVIVKGLGCVVEKGIARIKGGRDYGGRSTGARVGELSLGLGLGLMIVAARGVITKAIVNGGG